MMASFLPGWGDRGMGQGSRVTRRDIDCIQRMVEELMSDVRCLTQEVDDQKGLTAEAEKSLAAQTGKVKELEALLETSEREQGMVHKSLEEKTAVINDLQALLRKSASERYLVKEAAEEAKNAYEDVHDRLSKVCDKYEDCKKQMAAWQDRLQAAEGAKQAAEAAVQEVHESLAAQTARAKDLEARLQYAESERNMAIDDAGMYERDYDDLRGRLKKICSTYEEQLAALEDKLQATESSKQAAEAAQQEAEAALLQLLEQQSSKTAAVTTAAPATVTSTTSKLEALAAELSAALQAAIEQHAACVASFNIITTTAQQAAIQAATASTPRQTKAAVGVTASMLQQMMQELQAESRRLEQDAIACDSLVSQADEAAATAAAAGQQQLNELQVPSILSDVQTDSSSCCLSSCSSVYSLDGDDTSSSMSSSSSSVSEAGDDDCDSVDQDASAADVSSEDGVTEEQHEGTVEVVVDTAGSSSSSNTTQLQQQEQQPQGTGAAEVIVYYTTCYQDRNIISRLNAVRLCLNINQVEYEEVNVGREPEYVDVIRAAEGKLNITYPLVFVNGKSIGGPYELENYDNWGVLGRILQGVSVKTVMKDIMTADKEEWERANKEAAASVESAVINRL